MIKFKKIIFLVALLFITNCNGYKPLYSLNEINFNIISIESSGDLKINRIIERNLSIYKNNPNKNKNLFLEIISEQKINITSKDNKGDPKTFAMQISVRTLATDGANNKKQANFVKTLNYNTKSNKFDLTQYEKSVKENLTKSIIEEINLFLHSL